MSAYEPQTGMEKCYKQNLIINYLPWFFFEKEVFDLLQDVIPVAKVKVIRKKDGSSKGFGFVNVFSKEDGEMAIDVFNGLPVSGKRLKVAWSRPGKRPACNLCVRNIPLHWRTEDLKRRFQIFGTLLGCRVLWDSKRNLNRAIGFVRYDRPEDARSAFAMMNGVLPVDGISKIKVEIAYRDQIYNANAAPPSVYSDARDSVYSDARDSVFSDARESVYSDARDSVYSARDSVYSARDSVYSDGRDSAYQHSMSRGYSSPRSSEKFTDGPTNGQVLNKWAATSGACVA